MQELAIEPCDYGRLVPYTVHCDGAPGGKRASFKLLQWAGALRRLDPLRQRADRLCELRARLQVVAAPPPAASVPRLASRLVSQATCARLQLRARSSDSARRASGT